jgi:hypothetical protein
VTELSEKVRQFVVIDERGCWNWPRAKVRKGYGVVHYQRKQHYTHRVMYEAAKGEIPNGLQIDHLCRNTSCCNPDHLDAVSPKENTRRADAARGGQRMLRRGSHCPHGHAFTNSNTYVDQRGQISCRECRKRRHEEWAEKRRSGG